MDGWFTNLVNQLLSQVPVIPLLFIFAISVAILATIKVEKFHRRFVKTEADCKKIETDISPKLKNISDDIRTLITVVKLGNSALDLTLFKTQSPVSLTDVGIEILEKSGGRRYIDENLAALLIDLEKRELKTALDVENIAASVLLFKSNQTAFTPIKNYIYNNPEFVSELGLKATLDLGKIAQVMGIYLRDKYLEKHPELKIE